MSGECSAPPPVHQSRASAALSSFRLFPLSVADLFCSVLAAKKKCVKRGVKEVVKALKKGEKGCVQLLFCFRFVSQLMSNWGILLLLNQTKIRLVFLTNAILRALASICQGFLT